MTDAQRWQWMIVAALGLGLLYLLAPILTPFVIAALLAYMGDPLADRLEVLGLKRIFAVVVVFVGLTAVALTLLAILVPMVQEQIVLLVSKLPAYLNRLRELLLPLLGQFTDEGGQLLDWDAINKGLGAHLRELGSATGKIFATISKSGLVLAGWLANLVLIPVVTFYLLRDWDHLMLRIRELLPRKQEPVITDLARESDEVLGAFFRGQLVVMLALGTIYTVGLWIVGLDLALLVGMIAGLVSFVPYLGFIIGILLAGVLAMIQFQDFLHLGGVVLVFAIGQAIEGMLLTPLLIGERIGLHPVAVIFAVLAGGALFGFFGVLLALPVAAVIAVILRHMRHEYVSSDLYSGNDTGEDSSRS
ncbi:MAG: AI-2E family transporter [Gammaproteobacteria bacterium]|nr:AI-2E family transporter [Gammaproteobacteria bacterium]